MALIIRPTQDKLIEIPGLDISLESIYVRIEFAARSDGKTIEIAPASYLNKDKYKTGNPCITSVPMQPFRVEIQPDELQSLHTAHEYTKQVYESLGYDVEIEL